MGATSKMYAEIQENIHNAIEAYAGGDCELLESLMIMEQHRKKMDELQKTIKEFKDEFLTEIQNEALNYQGDYHGNEISVRAGGKMYSYKHITEWIEADKAKKDIEEKSKAAFIASQKSLTSVNEDGEIIEMPKITYRKDSVVIKLKK
jgi:hypothetical protein